MRLAEDAYDRGDYATALRELRPLAEQGNHSAQFSWAYATRMDMGCPRILNWRCSGIASLPIKAIGSHRMTWA